MRYFTEPTISFTDAQGRTVAIKDMREPPDYTAGFTYKKQDGELLDSVASRQDVFGEGREGDSYKIFEANLVALVDAKFILDNVRNLVIPQ